MYRAARGNVSHSYSENWKSCSASLSFDSKKHKEAEQDFQFSFFELRLKGVIDQDIFRGDDGPRAAEKRVLADADVAVGP